jgi:hypothetical protein
MQVRQALLQRRNKLVSQDQLLWGHKGSQADRPPSRLGGAAGVGDIVRSPDHNQTAVEHAARVRSASWLGGQSCPDCLRSRN